MQISLLHVLCKFLPYFLCGTMLLCNCFVSSFFDSYSVSKRLQLCASRELENKSHEKLAKFSDKSFNMTNTLTCTARICTIKVHTAHTLHKGGGQKSLPSFQFLALYIYVIVECCTHEFPVKATWHDYIEKIFVFDTLTSNDWFLTTSLILLSTSNSAVTEKVDWQDFQACQDHQKSRYKG